MALTTAAQSRSSFDLKSASLPVVAVLLKTTDAAQFAADLAERVAVVEAGTVARTYQCAQAKDAARIGPDTAFEIGSVSKTTSLPSDTAGK